MSSLLPLVTFGRTENSIGKVGILAPIHIRSPLVTPEGPGGLPLSSLAMMQMRLRQRMMMHALSFIRRGTFVLDQKT
jgi:hypothetical protein